MAELFPCSTTNLNHPSRTSKARPKTQARKSSRAAVYARRTTSTTVRRGPACFYSSKRTTHPHPDLQIAPQMPDNTIFIPRQPITASRGISSNQSARRRQLRSERGTSAMPVAQPLQLLRARQQNNFTAPSPVRRSTDPRAVPENPRSSLSLRRRGRRRLRRGSSGKNVKKLRQKGRRPGT